MTDEKSLSLTVGDLRFGAYEAGTGPVALCLHGFPDHARSYREQLEPLARAGYRAIAPTMRGYEPSSQPADADYNMVRLAEDVVGWIDNLGEDKVHLVGHDWGAVVAYTAAAMAPERFHSLTTIAIPHPGRLQSEGIRKLPSQILNSWYIIFFQLRGIADYVVERNDWAFIEKLWRDWSPGWDFPPEELAAVKETLALPGVKRAALGYYRAVAKAGSEASKQGNELVAGQIHVPTLAITGALDGCMDTRLHDLTLHKDDFPKGLEVQRFENSGHFVHQEEPEIFNDMLIDWLGRNTPASIQRKQSEPCASS